MKKNNIVVVLVLALVAFLFLRNTSSTFTASKTLGVTPATGSAISSIAGMLTSIFGSSNSAYSAGDVSAPEGEAYYSC